MKEIIFVSGIGTNVGKSYATGWLANKLNSEKKNAICYESRPYTKRQARKS